MRSFIVRNKSTLAYALLAVGFALIVGATAALAAVGR